MTAGRGKATVRYGTVWRESRGKADTRAELIPVVSAACRPQLMAARPRRWLERLTAEVSSANRSPGGEGSEVWGVFGDRVVREMLEKMMSRGHGGYWKMELD